MGLVMVQRLGVTLAQLEFFVAVADAGSISAAAEALHTSQSNVSVAIGKLERHLGVELLVRHRAKGVTPTASGRDLASRARRVLREVQSLEEAGHALASEPAGDIAVGSFPPLTPFYVPALLRDLQSSAPGLVVTVREGPLDLLQHQVAAAELDVALVYGLNVPDALVFTAMAEIVPHVIVAADSPLADREWVSLAELSDQTMVTLDLAFSVDRGRAVFDALGLPRPAEVSATSVETMRALVAAGIGFAMLNQRLATDTTVDGGRVAALSLTDEITPLPLGTIRRPASWNPRLRAVTDVLARQARERHGPLTPLSPPQG
jgi:DNA-binding transcriptional LysR family regulator